jgi:hypothetical protein
VGPTPVVEQLVDEHLHHVVDIRELGPVRGQARRFRQGLWAVERGGRRHRHHDGGHVQFHDHHAPHDHDHTETTTTTPETTTTTTTTTTETPTSGSAS